MFVTVFRFRIKTGEEANVVAHYEAWQRDRLGKVQGFISGELLRGVGDPQEFVGIAHFESEEASRAIANNPKQDAWYQHLAGMAETEPLFFDGLSTWRVEQPIRAGLPL